MKFIKSVTFLILISLILSFVNLINLKINFGSASQIKNIADQSDIYPLVSAGLRDDLAKNTAPAFQGVILEIANNIVTEENIKDFVNSLVDQYFAIVNDPKLPKKITVDYSKIQSELKAEINKESAIPIAQIPQLSENSIISLEHNPLLYTMQNLNLLLLINFGLILLLLLVLALGGTSSTKLKWPGSTLLTSGLLVIGEAVTLFLITSDKISEPIIHKLGLQGNKYILGINKFITTIVNQEKIYYLVAGSIILILGLILIIVGFSIGKEKKDFIPDYNSLKNDSLKKPAS